MDYTTSDAVHLEIPSADAPTEDEESRWMKTKEVARDLHISEREVLYMGDRGELTKIIFGKRAVRFLREEVEDWIHRREAEAKKAAARRRARHSDR